MIGSGFGDPMLILAFSISCGWLLLIVFLPGIIFWLGRSRIRPLYPNTIENIIHVLHDCPKLSISGLLSPFPLHTFLLRISLIPLGFVFSVNPKGTTAPVFLGPFYFL